MNLLDESFASLGEAREAAVAQGYRLEFQPWGTYGYRSNSTVRLDAAADASSFNWVEWPWSSDGR